MGCMVTQGQCRGSRNVIRQMASPVMASQAPGRAPGALSATAAAATATPSGAQAQGAHASWMRSVCCCASTETLPLGHTSATNANVWLRGPVPRSTVLVSIDEDRPRYREHKIDASRARTGASLSNTTPCSCQDAQDGCCGCWWGRGELCLCRGGAARNVPPQPVYRMYTRGCPLRRRR